MGYPLEPRASIECGAFGKPAELCPPHLVTIRRRPERRRTGPDAGRKKHVDILPVRSSMGHVGEAEIVRNDDDAQVLACLPREAYGCGVVTIELDVDESIDPLLAFHVPAPQ